MQTNDTTPRLPHFHNERGNDYPAYPVQSSYGHMVWFGDEILYSGHSQHVARLINNCMRTTPM